MRPPTRHRPHKTRDDDVGSREQKHYKSTPQTAPMGHAPRHAARAEHHEGTIIDGFPEARRHAGAALRLHAGWHRPAARP